MEKKRKRSKKPKKSFEQKFEEMMVRNDEVVAKISSSLDDLRLKLTESIRKNARAWANIRRSFNKGEADLATFLKDSCCVFLYLQKQMDDHLAQMKEMTRINGLVDDTLGNVLLAIRQNEYLQAYYPEQHGFKAMKISGPHPAKFAVKV